MSTLRRLCARARPLTLGMLLAASSPVFADATTDQAKALLESGQSRQAYELLISLEAERAGNETYDLLLGIAAADIGRNTNAVLALERVLAVNPNNARARAEIARAYFALGEVKTAREEFETVKKLGIPTEVAKTIDKYLSAVDRAEDEGRPTLKGFVEASIGYDTNVNGGTSRGFMAIPGFGTLRLEGLNTEQSDGYTGAAAGVNARVPIDARLALVAGTSASKRINDTWDEVDTGNWDGNAGLIYKDDKNVYSATLQGGTSFVDNRRYRDAMGVIGQWQHNYNQRNQATVFLQYADLSYPDSRDDINATQNPANPAMPRDADRWVTGVGVAHALRDFKTVFFGSLYAGFEKAQLNEALDFDLVGIRMGGEHYYQEDLSFFANLGYEDRNYKDPYGGYNEERDEATTYVGIGLVYTPVKQWKITPQVQYGHNHSKIDFFTYSREVYSVTVRYDF